MPELPEVETVSKGLNQLTLQQQIMGGEVLLERTLAYPISVTEFCQGMKGVAISHWQRRGKYLLAKLNKSKHTSPSESPLPSTILFNQDAGWLGVHLRMTGQLLWVKQDEPLQKHTRIRLFFPKNQELRFVDIRTFGKFWLVPSGIKPEEIITGLQKLGPEPLSQDFSLAYFKEKLYSSRRQIKNLLLDQGIVAGIGNIYADEALFSSGILPKSIAANLTENQIKNLHSSIIKVLQAAVDKGGTTFSDFLNLLGVSGNYGDVAWVYGRQGKPCRVCDTPIEKIKLGGRSAHFCPHCQK